MKNTLRELLTTEEFAQSVRNKPQTVRKNYCLAGHCYGIKPVKIGGRLLWPSESVAQLLSGSKEGKP